MVSTRTCPTCGLSVPKDSPDDFCPRCAFEQALASTQGGDEGPGAAGTPLSFGDYELMEEIGRGGMGVVYKARQKSLNRAVAVKMLQHGRFSEAGLVRRFRLEAEAAAHLEHPNIVPIYEIGEHDGQPFYAMRLIEGHSLDRELERGRTPMPPARAARLIATIARAVHHAHQLGVLHRDLKPHNVLLDGSGEPHLTDFGLARTLESTRAAALAQSGTISGTPSFMAPEQAAGSGAITTAADIYSLGVMLFMLLTGRPPFVGATPVETLRMAMVEEPPQPRTLRPTLPRDLETICLKCLRKEPACRYGSAEALADDLDRWWRREPILARRVGGVERTWLWCRRQPLRAGLIAALVLTALTGTGAVLDQWRRTALERRRAEEAAALARREQYNAHVALAQILIEQSQYIRAQQTLAEAGPESLRGWEWGWLMRACHRDSMTLSTDGMPLTSVAFSSDGRLLAYGSFDQTARLLELPSGRELHVLRGHNDLVFVGGFSSDGRQLVTASWDKTVRVWDVTEGTTRHILEGHDDVVYCAQFSPDDRWVATGGKDGTVRLWDAATGRFLRSAARYDDGSVMSIAWSHDGRWLAFAGGSGLLAVTRPAGVCLLDLATGSVRTLHGHTATIPTIAFSSDSHFIATASWDGTACIADVTSADDLRPVFRQETVGPLFGAAFSPDGTTLALAGAIQGGASSSIVDLRTGRVIRSLEGHSQPVRAVAFSRDGVCLATASFDGTAKLWSIPADADHASLESHEQAVWAVAASPDGRLVATGSADQTAKVWDASDQRLLATIRVGFPIVSLAFTADGARLITNGPENSARVWRIAASRQNYRDDSRMVRQIRHEAGIRPGGAPQQCNNNTHTTPSLDLILRGHAGVVLAVAADPLGRWFATGAKDGSVRLWDAGDGSCTRTIDAHDDWVTSVNFSADGSRLVTASADRTAAIWSAETGRRLGVLSGHEAAVLRAVFSPDGALVATGSADHTARLWNVQTSWQTGSRRCCTPFGAPLRGHTDSVGGVTFSPSGDRLVTTGAGLHLLTGAGRDSAIIVWDVATGHALARMRPHENQALSVAFTPDGRSLITGSADHTARIFEAFPWRRNEYVTDVEPGLGECIERFKRDFAVKHRPNRMPSDRHAHLRPGGEVNTAVKPSLKMQPVLSIAARTLDSPAGAIDLTDCYNAALDEVWQPVENLWRIDADVAALPAGQFVHGGTSFDARGIIQLGSDGDDWRVFPASVPIPIGQVFARLHVLHGGVPAWAPETEGRSVAVYRLHYADGSDADLEVRYGEALRSFWSTSDRQPACTKATVAWRWQSPFPARRPDDSPDARRLYHATFANPRPHDIVDRIEFSTRQAHVAPFLVAMTVE